MERYQWNLVWRVKWRRGLKKLPACRNVWYNSHWMNLSKLHQGSKMRIRKRRIKFRAEEGNCHGTWFKPLLGQLCWSHLALQDLHEWHLSVLCYGKCQRPDPAFTAGAIGLLRFVRMEIFVHDAAMGTIMTHCKHFLQAFKTLESYGHLAEKDSILP